MKPIRKRMTVMIISMLIIALEMSGLNNYFTYEASAATFEEINQPEVFLRQINGDMQCTLVAAAMLVRRAALVSGSTDWAGITVDKVMEQAWLEGQGLKYTFTYAGITVNRGTFGADPVNEAISLLSLHPEGIVLYDQVRSPRSHAILLTDYTGGIFYSADPSEAAPAGRIPNSSALVQVEDAEFYWYVSSGSIAPLSPSVTEENIPSQVTDINIYAATLSQTSFSYDGTEKKPTVAIQGLTENTDYIVSYSDNVNPGLAVVNIIGIGAYSGMVVKDFEITDASVLEALSQVKIAITKQTIETGKTAAVKVTLPVTLKSVKEYSGNLSGIYNEVKISYASSDKKIASVNSSGKITGKKKGTTKISVTVQAADATQKTVVLKIKVK